MKQLDKKVILFIDNCPGHPEVNDLSNVTVQYLPPQTTSHLQPCDQGIIQCFKRHYRQLLLQQHIIAVERKEDFKPTVLDAMIYTQTAWEKVTASTIANCFRHAGFCHPAGVNNFPTKEDQPEDSVQDLVQHACLLAGIETSNCEGYTEIDAEVATSGTLSDEEIASQVQQDKTQQDREDEDSDDDELPTPPSKDAVSDAFQTLKMHFLCKDPSKIKDLLALETAIVWVKNQTTLNDFFS